MDSQKKQQCWQDFSGIGRSFRARMSGPGCRWCRFGSLLSWRRAGPFLVQDSIRFKDMNLCPFVTRSVPNNPWRDISAFLPWVYLPRCIGSLKAPLFTRFYLPVEILESCIWTKTSIYKKEESSSWGSSDRSTQLLSQNRYPWICS